MKAVICIAVLCFFATAEVFAGPPFRTDDPEPVNYCHSEVYLFSTGTNGADGTNWVGPALEYNYGILPNTMFHLIMPLAYDFPKGGASHFGYGDTELGVKYRFVREKDNVPAVGIFPLIEVPSGDADEGLGSEKTQYFFPLWLQKNFGQWTTYGGGGYWINPGDGNRNWWFSGILLQYAFSERFYLGGEIFRQAAGTVDGKDSLSFNAGGSLPLENRFQLLFSVGRNLANTSDNQFSYYLAIYREL